MRFGLIMGVGLTAVALHGCDRGTGPRVSRTSVGMAGTSSGGPMDTDGDGDEGVATGAGDDATAGTTTAGTATSDATTEPVECASGGVADACGVCGGDNSSCADCNGEPHGSAVVDQCGVCGGDDACVDCEGVPNGGKVLDECGVCAGNNSTCLDCEGVPNGGAVVDDCGECGGDCVCDAECQLWLAEHNDYRQQINAGTLGDEPVPSPPLVDFTWDAALAQVAYDYASMCTWGHNDARSADYAALGGSGYIGENIAAGRGRQIPAVVDAWMSEHEFYDYDANTCADGEACGHYTQIAWAQTTRIGCAEVQCPTIMGLGFSNAQLQVCNYAPGGNFGGRRPY